MDVHPDGQSRLSLTGKPVANLLLPNSCMQCENPLCMLDCPPDAIHENKQWVRGVERWYVDFDKCVPYFVKTFGCAICIEVCPWSEPGRGADLSAALLAKRQPENSDS